MQWRIECKYSGKGYDVTGTLNDALRSAQEQCTTDSSCWVVWAEPSNVRMAEVTLRGPRWLKTRLSGPELVTLMQRHRKTIAGLAFRIGVTQQQMRQLRDRGLNDPYAVRDWLQAITEEDPGPLPERQRIRDARAEVSCANCGFPFDRTDWAHEYAGDVFCSIACCRQSRGWQ